MSFLAKLKIDGDTFNVLECKLSLSQAIDNSGKPSAEPQGGIVSLTLESTASSDFFRWMISNTETRDGEIIFYRRDAISKMRDLKFEKAYCIGYNETFLSAHSTPMRIELVLSAKSLSMNGVEFKRNWPMEI
ncbi:type VI secretion system tube protein TssD [Moheibacter stercoris]|uniref:Type VI secretion system needle protein Hcp n=1 Tax=Moheibacter stercoris TaxID=1628251 RepID=A0ABV2LUT4_9FLAO